MKMKLLLFLCGILSGTAQVLHEYLQISGCSDSEREFMMSLDGEEVFFADFKTETLVDSQPPFVDHISYPEGYDLAKQNQQACRQNLKICETRMADLPQEQVPPSNVVVYNRNKVELGQQNTLICHISGFYPAPVNVSWTSNSEKVSGSLNVPFPNSDGTFTQISRLQFVPQLGDIYSCSVEHPALPEVQTMIWDVEKSQPGIGPLVFCGVGLAVGLVGMAVGTFFFIKGNECR